jgi:electron transfer flavoprotein-quinone oxidoreductase
MTTGRIAGETIAELHANGTPCSEHALAEYRRRLDATYVMKDMKKYKKLPKFMDDNRHMLDVYPRLLTQASHAWFRVDGVDKRTKENEILSSFRKSRKMTGLIGDAFKLMRVWR